MTDTEAPTVLPRRSPHVVTTEIAGSTVVYDPRHHVAHLLNPSAGAVWSALEIDSDFDTLSLRLAEDFAADPGVVRRDVATILEHLGSLHVIVTPDEAPDDVEGPSDVAIADQPPDSATRAADLYEVPPAHATSSGAPMPAPPHRTSTFQAIDLRFAVATDDADLVAYLGEKLASLHVAGEPDLWYVVTRDSDDPLSGRLDLRVGTSPRCAGVHQPAQVVSRLLWDYNHRAITTAEGRLLLHASAVNTPAGIIVLAAPADSGKSTLVTALVHAGFGYVTDECAVVHVDDLTVEAYPKPVGLDPGSWELFDQRLPSDDRQPAKRWLPLTGDPDDRTRLHLNAGDLAPIAAVVFPHYEPGNDGELEPVSPEAALLRLARNTFRLADDPQVGLDRLRSLALAVPAYDLPVDDLPTACAAISSIVALLVDGPTNAT